MSRNSDRRKIKDVQNITGEHALKKLSALQTVSYRHIDEDPTLPLSIGWIAQDFAKEFPDHVRKKKNDDGVKPIKKPKPPREPSEPQPHPPGAQTPTQPEPEPQTPATPLEIMMRVNSAALQEDESEEEDELDPGGPEGFQISSYEEMIPLQAEAVKYLGAIIRDLQNSIKELEKKVDKLKPSLT